MDVDGGMEAPPRTKFLGMLALPRFSICVTSFTLESNKPGPAFSQAAGVSDLAAEYVHTTRLFASMIAPDIIHHPFDSSNC